MCVCAHVRACFSLIPSAGLPALVGCLCVCARAFLLYPWLPEGWEAFRGRTASKIDYVLCHGMISVVVLNLALNMFLQCVVPGYRT